MRQADLITVQERMWSKLDAFNAIHQGALTEGHTETAKIVADSIVRLLGEIRAIEAAGHLL
jgi:hypothetical protein